ncbi:hypothetical protein ACE8FZ_19935 [Peribacillus frigoritolerans]|uniref:hypothetical protein n=1 Tax=Peribacillus frigoritolerans TaxID=450367 RepID=UPI0035D0B722
MYYERLKNIYKSRDLQKLFPDILISEFDMFIRKQLKDNNKYINPYKFSYQQNISINDTVKFFIYFTGNDGLFDLLYYFDCSNLACVDTRIYLNSDDPDEIISCEECGKRYAPKTIQKYIKVLFKIKNFIIIPEQRTIERKDPNSTFEAIGELPPNLKIESPSSLGESSQFIDEGDEASAAVDLSLVFSENDDYKGKPISTAIERFKRICLSMEEE